jgi:hypothetical protein
MILRKDFAATATISSSRRRRLGHVAAPVRRRRRTSTRAQPKLPCLIEPTSAQSIASRRPPPRPARRAHRRQPDPSLNLGSFRDAASGPDRRRDLLKPRLRPTGKKHTRALACERLRHRAPPSHRLRRRPQRPFRPAASEPPSIRAPHSTSANIRSAGRFSAAPKSQVPRMNEKRQGHAPARRLSRQIVEQLWSRADATNGNRWQTPGRKKRLAYCDPLPTVTTSCVYFCMVRTRRKVRT